MKKRYIVAALFLTLSLILSSCGVIDLGIGNREPACTTQGGKTEVPLTGDELVKVTFIDVGQGDSSFIELPNGECILIDAAEREDCYRVLSFIKNSGYKRIDHLIVTHPHSDHMGGMVKVIEEFEIGSIYMTNAVNNTSSFEELLDAIERKSIPLKQSKKGIKITSGENFEAMFLSPVSEEYDNLNDYSSVVKLTYKSKSFLFMGDAEKLAEKELGDEVACDVVKIGHHGSNTSSCSEFVKKTGADYGVISVGETNKYGHPHSEIVDRWLVNGTVILRTDEKGNITFITDGNGLTIKTAKGEVPATPTVPGTSDATEVLWILNINTKKVHDESCSTAANMKEENKEYSSKTLDELIKEGYTLCGICNPEE